MTFERSKDSFDAILTNCNSIKSPKEKIDLVRAEFCKNKQLYINEAFILSQSAEGIDVDLAWNTLLESYLEMITNIDEWYPDEISCNDFILQTLHRKNKQLANNMEPDLRFGQEDVAPSAEQTCCSEELKQRFYAQVSKFEPKEQLALLAEIRSPEQIGNMLDIMGVREADLQRATQKCAENSELREVMDEMQALRTGP